ncbi:T-cell activation Rho GTPase-activating protein [Frankliniella fusca]|uniref:T-cell activation Rho GTPase-activating protein n=1 Tax=Frankliniella fusca TaxID=407009 RepID=A0AAE1LHT0_9NEOP|nr:T-cell activation Rho GTPase-activating protein [Frankliniella fusca]
MKVQVAVVVVVLALVAAAAAGPARNRRQLDGWDGGLSSGWSWPSTYSSYTPVVTAPAAISYTPVVSAVGVAPVTTHTVSRHATYTPLPVHHHVELPVVHHVEAPVVKTVVAYPLPIAHSTAVAYSLPVHKTYVDC